MVDLEVLSDAVFVGHLSPPDGEPCDLTYRFRGPLAGPAPAAVRNQRRAMGFPFKADVICVAATVSMPALGLEREEVVASFDPPGASQSRRMVMQSLQRPDLGVTVLVLAADSQSLEGGDETWAPGTPPLIAAARREPRSPTGSQGSPAQSPSAAKAAAGKKPRASSGRPGAKAVVASSAAKPSKPGSEMGRSGSASGLRRASPAPGPAPGAAAPPPLVPAKRFVPAVRPPEEDEPREPGLDDIIGGEGAGRPMQSRASIADLARREAAAAAMGAQSPTARGGDEDYLRPDVLAGAPQQGTSLGALSPDALDDEIRAADAAACERLVAAAVAGETGDVRQLLARLGPDRIAAKGVHEGLTPLMGAAARGRSEVIELLVQKRAKLEAVDPSGWSALMHAVHGQRPDCVRLLLDAKAAASIVAEGDEQKTPLMLAAAGSRPDVCAMIVKAGAQKEMRDQEGQKAIHYAAKRGNNGAIMALVAAKAKLDDPNHDGLTPLLLAVKANRAETVQILLSKRANINVTDPEGRSAGKLAGIYEHDRVLRVLAEAGA